MSLGASFPTVGLTATRSLQQRPDIRAGQSLPSPNKRKNNDSQTNAETQFQPRRGLMLWRHAVQRLHEHGARVRLCQGMGEFTARIVRLPTVNECTLLMHGRVCPAC